ncbi:S8 family serine peptidase [Sphingomonas floccifaciens]|uniref:S8 family serine peptidase n=1 Tax=Sphingomonas floccifaciens TaxID=1844115 RepID=A0ABW4NHM9_9SPHN
MKTITNLRTATAIASATMLAACGGGGGVASNGSTAPPIAAPAPTPSPSPAPAPAPSTSYTPTAEYTASKPLVGMKAQAAYGKGLNGKGVTIAVIDSGIDLTNPEFTGRISTDSKSFDASYARCGTCAPETISFGLQDVQGHGTGTASIAAAAANGSGIQGVAPGATILALKVAGPNLDAVSPTSTLTEGGLNGSAIPAALNHAVDKGAFVVTMSINGSLAPGAATEARSAMGRVRSSNMLVVESVRNFSGDSHSGQISESLVGTDLAGKDWYLFGIRVNSNLQAHPDNGSPGALADRTLAVVADGVEVTRIGGGTEMVTGNSLAAPAIAGAAALLKEYWPQLGGKEISRILLDTAKDLGTPGVDQVYGVGLLDLENALKPKTASVPDSSYAIASTAARSLVFSGAFGSTDGATRWAGFAGQTVAVDPYGRDFAVDIGAAGQARPAQSFSLYGTLAGPTQAWTLIPNNQAGAMTWTDRNVGPYAAAVTGPRAFGFRALEHVVVSGQVGGGIETSGLVTGSLLRPLGIATYGSTLEVHFGRWTLTTASAASSRRGAASRTQRAVVTTPIGVALGLASAREIGSALGLTGIGDYAIRGANSTFTSVSWNGNLAGFRLVAEAMAGRTVVDARIARLAFEPIISTGFRLQADRRLLGGLTSFGLTAPLRVDRAPVSFSGPKGFDLSTLAVTDVIRRFDLAPNARELDLEVGWAKDVHQARVTVGAAYGANAGHQRGVTNAAAWMRLSTAL